MIFSFYKISGIIRHPDDVDILSCLFFVRNCFLFFVHLFVSFYRHEVERTFLCGAYLPSRSHLSVILSHGILLSGSPVSFYAVYHRAADGLSQRIRLFPERNHLLQRAEAPTVHAGPACIKYNCLHLCSPALFPLVAERRNFLS